MSHHTAPAPVPDATPDHAHGHGHGHSAQPAAHPHGAHQGAHHGAQHGADQAETRRPWTILGLMLMAQFMVVLDVSVVNVALPSIGKSLSFSSGDYQWVVSAYVLLSGGLLLFGGRTKSIDDVPGNLARSRFSKPVRRAPAVICPIRRSASKVSSTHSTSAVAPSMASATAAGPPVPDLAASRRRRTCERGLRRS